VLSSKEIRQIFIDFFRERGHIFIPSSPVIPWDDPTLLFANAGMNQFKNIFLGIKEPEVKRAVNTQKCIRAGGKHNDLEAVGKDGYHHTFFEMLGNWSFGDYYKKEAIEWAWELLTVVYQLPKEKLFATVHNSDEESYNLWKNNTDIDLSHIFYCGDKDNFWEMGETGPCGPCTEIHYDCGIEHCTKKDIPDHKCQLNGNCNRFIELWNLVFIQYNREENGSLSPLKSRYVDTGAGFERLVRILQNAYSNYETDLFMPIIDKISQMSGVPYNPESAMSFRVIADHIRCLCFALADGGFPSNEGRGYVLRRILRRAARHGRLLGFSEPFMFHLVDPVIEIMSESFPELKGKEAYLKMVIKAEEERFNATLDKGLEIFDQICANSTGKVIPGKDAFQLYDTYGFPLDLTINLAEERGFKVDTAGFEEEMKKQRERARKSSKFNYKWEDMDWIELLPSTATEFVGYDTFNLEANIQRYRIDDEGKIHLQLDRTPFYAESGGQIADTGRIYNEDFELEVIDVKKIEEQFIHIGHIIKGAISSPLVKAEIDLKRRKDIARNHTATHILHRALKMVLGEYVQQKGSYVAPDYLRFDFTHLKALTQDEINRVEDIVNEIVKENRPVHIDIKDINEARSDGAIALFGEKYGQKVRVVSVENFSKELCGGTHISATGEIGLFKILSESSSSAGIRRIEAVTGRGAEKYVRSLQERIANLASMLNVPEKMIETRLENLQNRITELEDELKKKEQKNSSFEVDRLLDKIAEYPDFRLLCATVEAEPEKLRELGDILKDRAKDAISLLFTIDGEKITVLCVVGRDLMDKFNAGKIVKAVSQKLNGKGGGRADSAMGGGKNPEKLSELMPRIPDIVRSTL
jgi:alanyl-tRNA synthetase